MKQLTISRINSGFLVTENSYYTYPGGASQTITSPRQWAFSTLEEVLEFLKGNL